jgi:hypothetical protein
MIPPHRLPAPPAATVSPASQPTQGVAIRRGRAGSPRAHRRHDLSLTGAAPVDRKLPGFPPADSAADRGFPWPTATRQQSERLYA